MTHVERYYPGKLRQAAVAAHCGMSTSAFSRAFKAEYGLTFSDYLMRFRIGQACCLLRLGTHTATTAGLAVGFDDASHFARAFRKLMGTSPSSYRRQRPAGKHIARRRQRRGVLLHGAVPWNQEWRVPAGTKPTVFEQETSPDSDVRKPSLTGPGL